MPSPLRLLLPLLAALALPAADRRAFTIEDLYRLKGIQHLALSPDGSRLLFEVNGQDLARAGRSSRVWLLETATGEARPLTAGLKSDTWPQWSRDGATAYFLSSRSGAQELMALDLAGGEARRVLAFPPGLESPQVRPGGGAVFGAQVFPEAGADPAEQARLAERLEKGPVQAHLADGLLYRHWDSWREFRVARLFHAPFGGPAEAITPATGDHPGHGLSFDLSPDGREVCVAVGPEKDPARSTNSDLFLVSLTGDRTPRRITGDNPAADQDPRWSPDGRHIAYRMQRRPGYESDRWRLAVHDRATGANRVLTEGVDNWVEAFQWSADGRWIYFTVQERGRFPLLRVALADGRVERVLEGVSIREFQLAPDLSRVYFTRSRVGEPVEVWSYAFASRDLRPLTRINHAVASEVDLRPAEELWVKGAGGRPVHVFLVKPHGFDPARKYPLILNVHGGPQMMWADTLRGDWQVYPGAGYVVAFPNPHGSTGYGQAYTEAISGDWNGKVMEDLDRVAEALAALPFVDAGRMGAMGWSWGGYAMMWLAGQPTRFKALASMMGVYDLRSMHGATEELWFPEWEMKGTPTSNPAAYARQTPSGRVAAFRTPTLVITGERDYRVPYTQSLQFFTDLQSQGVPSRLIVFKEDGHWPDALKSMPVYYNAHLEWFHRWLGGGPAPWSTEALIRNLVFPAPESGR